MASGRLKDLVAHGLLARRPYQEPGARTRYEYVLTERGSGVFTAFVALMQWGDTLRDDRRTSLKLEHAGCGGALHAEVRCDQGHLVGVAEGAVRLRDEEWVLRARARSGQ